MQWTNEDIEALKQNYEKLEYKDLALMIGRTVAAVRNKCWILNLRKKSSNWTAEEDEILRDCFRSEYCQEQIESTGVFEAINRPRIAIQLRASRLGLCSYNRKLRLKRKTKQNKFSTQEERNKNTSERTKKWIKENGHPRGFLGGRHTEEVKKMQSERLRKMMAEMSDEDKAKMSLKAMKTKEAKGTLYLKRPHGNWKQKWAEVGGKRFYSRSLWEANYARVLQHKKENGELIDWDHEPKTFWFDGVKRGTKSYLPDFLVKYNDREEYHEVKGYFDDRSKTKIKRMKKYHPDIKLVVIDSSEYKKVKSQYSKIISDWEFDAKGR